MKIRNTQKGKNQRYHLVIHKDILALLSLPPARASNALLKPHWSLLWTPVGNPHGMKNATSYFTANSYQTLRDLGKPLSLGKPRQLFTLTSDYIIHYSNRVSLIRSILRQIRITKKYLTVISKLIGTKTWCFIGVLLSQNHYSIDVGYYKYHTVQYMLNK